MFNIHSCKKIKVNNKYKYKYKYKYLQPDSNRERSMTSALTITNRLVLQI